MRKNIANDIAILKLENDVKLSREIQLACLPRRDQNIYPNRNGTEVYAVGWGKRIIFKDVKINFMIIFFLQAGQVTKIRIQVIKYFKTSS